MRYHKAFILITPLLILGLYESFYLKPDLIYIGLIFSNLLLLLTIKAFSKLWKMPNWWDYCILPVFFINGLAIYVSLLVNNLVIHALLIFNSLFVFYYLRNSFFYFAQKKQSGDIMKNFSSYGNFLIVFFISASIFGLRSFLGISLWILMFVFTVIVLMIVYEVLVTNEIKIKRGLHFIFLLALLMAEIIYAVSFLPFNYNILGLTVAICYYISIGILKFYLKNNISRRAVKLYLTTGSISILILLLTAQWL